MLSYRTRRRWFSTIVLTVAYVTLLGPIVFVVVASFDYGQRAYGAINGAITMPTSIARAAAPFLAALIWQASGGYTPVLWALLVVALTSAACFWLAVTLERRRVRPPAAGS